MTQDEATLAALEGLQAQVHAQRRMIAVLQDALSTALSAIAQATVGVDGYNEPVHYGRHSRTHLMSLSGALSTSHDHEALAAVGGTSPSYDHAAPEVA